jgi:stress response protein SCP2
MLIAPGSIFELGLSWDFFSGMNPVDLDAAAVLFDSMGQVQDAAFYK